MSSPFANTGLAKKFTKFCTMKRWFQHASHIQFLYLLCTNYNIKLNRHLKMAFTLIALFSILFFPLGSQAQCLNTQ